jgi:hypothetical protein
MLERLQRQLERTYEVEIEHAVQDFLITDRALASRIDSTDHPDVPEKLLIREGERDLDLGLFIDERVMESLRRDDPTTRLHPGNLESFLIALEGVSHFLYLVFNASHARPVSLFELELQAEVDKYVVCLLADGTAATATASPRWRRRLFEDFELEPDLDAEERDRYRAANQNARRYSASLERRFVARGGVVDMLAELRRFYRLSLGAKLDHIAKAA